jgi:1-acyl-sn-glycerol-3-phosphate acyltransferase
MYRLMVAWLSFLLRTYFRRIEVVGLDRIPEKEPVIFVLNHPNGLVDPVFLICYSPRQVTLLGKSPIFSMFFIGWIARQLDAIPVYRLQDEGPSGADKARMNQETFRRARELLLAGKTIAIFPEGTSHSDSKLKPLKSGAARIALGCEIENLKIVPAGLYYTAKRVFRSSALLYFGEPFSIAPLTAPGTGAEQSRAAVRALTEKIREALDQVTLQADHPDALTFIERAQRIFSAAGQQRSWSLETRGYARARIALRRRFILQRQFVERYRTLRQKAPGRVAALEARIRAFQSRLAPLGLSPEDLLPENAGSVALVARTLGLAALRFLALPLVVLGFATHFAPYAITGYLALRFAKEEEDLISTMNVLGAMLFYPLFWILFAALGAWFGLPAWKTLVVLPVCGYVALLFIEHYRADVGRVRALRLLLFNRDLCRDLSQEQLAIRGEILALET